MAVEQHDVELALEREICRLTADWLMCSVSPACVKLPAAAAAWKILSLSQSMGLRAFLVDRALFGGLGEVERGEVALRFERGHAPHAGCGHGLSEYVVLHVAGGEHAGTEVAVESGLVMM